MTELEGGTEGLTQVGDDMFEEPVKRIGVSGGTAPFFSLKLLNPEEGTSPTYYIGKDLSRATDEVSFYEDVENSSLSRDALGGLCEFLFPYLGILKTKEEGVEEEVSLLVLQNLHDGKEKLRLIDIKMGEKTASANWQGKSRLRAFKQRMFDELTNSTKEGYRLEGFDGCPKTLTSMETLTESMSEDKSGKACKKSRRLLFQSLTGDEILQHLLDLHTDVEESPDTYGIDEYLEIIMHEILQLLVKLSVSCHRVKVPQKWIGSSLAIGFDSGRLPSRTESEDDIRKTAIVRIFDWGRSELNTEVKLKELSEIEIADRQTFWDSYKRGIYTLSWIAASKYFNRFCCEEWYKVTFSVYDFDAMSEDDFMCHATVALKDTELTEIPLTRKSGKDGGSLSFSIKWVPTSGDSLLCGTCNSEDNSRLLGSWKIHVLEGKDLPNKDVSLTTGATSDPYVVIQAKSNNDTYHFEQMTSVIQENANPFWDETLSIPVARSVQTLQNALECAGLDCSNGNISSNLDDWIERIEASTLPEYSGSD